jgi:hypothetical protein
VTKFGLLFFNIRRSFAWVDKPIRLTSGGVFLISRFSKSFLPIEKKGLLPIAFSLRLLRMRNLVSKITNKFMLQVNFYILLNYLLALRRFNKLTYFFTLGKTSWAFSLVVNFLINSFVVENNQLLQLKIYERTGAYYSFFGRVLGFKKCFYFSNLKLNLLAGQSTIFYNNTYFYRRFDKFSF